MEAILEPMKILLRGLKLYFLIQVHLIMADGLQEVGTQAKVVGRQMAGLRVHPGGLQTDGMQAVAAGQQMVGLQEVAVGRLGAGLLANKG